MDVNQKRQLIEWSEMILNRRPAKYKDPKVINRIIQGEEREVSFRKLFPPFILIVSEGYRTEPNYINGVVERINAKYTHLLKTDRITVIGSGRNTRGMLKWVRRYVENSPICYSRIWLVYDKDDFPSDDFDNTQFSIDGHKEVLRKYYAAWSNPCIELWFVLHFQDVYSNIGREQYLEILKKYFPYDKTMLDIYNVLMLKGNYITAITRAKKLYRENMNSSPSKMVPATRMHELMDELIEFL